MARHSAGRRAGLAAALLAAAFAGGSGGAPAGEPAPEKAPAEVLASRFRDWLDTVDLLITPAEREAFLALGKDYQRQAFIEAFWHARDPYPQTARNEFRERWEARVAEAQQRFGKTIDDRLRMYAVFGPPFEIIPGRCPGVLDPLEIWHFQGSDLVTGDFFLVFRERHRDGDKVYSLWYPSSGFGLLSDLPGASVAQPSSFLQSVAEGCFRGDDVAAALSRAVDWERLKASGKLLPDPGTEWLYSFVSSSTDLPEGSGQFAARLDLTFPGRYQSRTVVQGLVAVPRTEVEPGADAQYPSYDFLIDGEVLRKGDLFEHFRYRFHFPQEELTGDDIPLLFQRYLRPGAYELVVRVQDLGSGRFFRQSREIEVPFGRSGSQLAAAAGPAGPESSGAAGGGAGAVARGAAGPAGGTGADPAAEANAALATGDQTLRILPAPLGLQVGNTRIEAVTSGEGVARVRFFLNGKPVMSKGSPPYSVEISLGDQPRIHTVEAVALDAAGHELARDLIELNAGPHRFSVRLVEPQRGGRYRQSLRAAAEVEVPEGDHLERVEMYLNETLVATLYQPPFVQPILLPPQGQVAYVRAVAYLTDGNSTEDLVYVNAPEFLDELKVEFVELFTTVVDRRGRPVEGLTKDDFVVREDGVEQQIRRFELVKNVPIYAGVLLDNSGSMAEEIGESVAGALRFFETVITPKDRAAVITFNHRPELVVRFTNDPEVLAGGVAGITAEGGTALYDSLIYALYYFSGIKGKRAIVLLSDGADEGSHYSFEEALDYARRTGVALYPIGLGLPSKGVQIRMLLQRLAEETGGRSFFISHATELGKVYDEIQQELRTQYLITYQSSATGSDRNFRNVEVQVKRDGAEAKTIRGYYP